MLLSPADNILDRVRLFKKGSKLAQPMPVFTGLSVSSDFVLHR